MTLLVQTAQYRYRGPHRCDVTRKSAPAELEPFAPSSKLLGWGLRMRREGQAKLTRAEALPPGPTRNRAMTEAKSYADMVWLSYEARYRAAMRVSYRRQRPAWDALLARPNAVLVCFCGDAERCHRRVLADILVKLGAEYLGELDSTSTPADWWPDRRPPGGA